MYVSITPINSAVGTLFNDGDATEIIVNKNIATTQPEIRYLPLTSTRIKSLDVSIVITYGVFPSSDCKTV